ncbi:hypothetical protein, partial [Pseudomonas aeruginosa]|uniref:hypothetical protein n=1 Tax=Pseudomonas aeruginosa TaxID=287 RepID=UPI00197F2EBE
PLENSVHPVSGLPKAPPDTQRPDWQGGLLIENQNIRAVVMKRSIVTLLPNASGPDRCYLRPAN